MRAYSLYGGSVELTFDEGKHAYFANGKKVGSVTGILKVINKPALMPWAAKMTAAFVKENLKPGVSLDEVQITQLCEAAKGAYRKKAQDSADLGHLAHEWFDDYLSGLNPPTPISKDLRNITEAFLTFVDKHNIQKVSTEQKLYSLSRNIAGTADLINLIDGELTITDYKTSKSGIYPEHFIQMGGYDICYSEENEYLATPVDVKRHVIVNCNKLGELWVGQTTEVVRNRKAFDAALDLSRALEQIEIENKEIITRVKAA